MQGFFPVEKGGRNAAFFLFLFAVAVLGFGGSVQYPLVVLRAGAFGGGLWFLLRRRETAIEVGPYPLLVAGFVLLSIGHAFSSVYFWVSFQHAANIALAAILLAWAVLLHRKDPGTMWNSTVLVAVVFAIAEVGIALAQRVYGEVPRPPGTLDNANYLSEFLVAVSLLCLAHCFWQRGGRPSRYAAAAFGMMFLAAAFSLSRSRGVLLASVPAIGVLLVSRWGIRKGGGLFVATGIPVLAVLGVQVVKRFAGPDIYGYSRWIIWKSAIRTFLEHPFGVGIGGFKFFWFTHQSPVLDAFRRYGKVADTAHNEFLEILSGLGGVGFLLFSAVLVVPLLLAIRHRKEIAPEHYPIASGSASVLVLSGANALFHSNFHVFGIFFLDAMMLGALVSCMPDRRSPAATIPTWGIRLGMAACTALFVASIATGIGASLFDRGERLLRAGDLDGAERALTAAVSVDPFRSSYPDALSAVHYRRYLADRTAGTGSRNLPESLSETIRWERRARDISPRDPKYSFRLSGFFFESYRFRKAPSDAEAALRSADEALRIDPYRVEILWQKAGILVSLGRGEEAVRLLESAVSVEPNFCRGYAKLSNLSRDSDPALSDRWARAAEECRVKAAGMDLEENEKWLVGLTENR